MKFRLAGDPKIHEVELISRDDAQIRARIDGEEIEARLAPAAIGAIIRIDDRPMRFVAARQRDTILVALGPAQFEFAPSEQTARRRSSTSMAQTVTAPMPGKVLKILVEERQQVESGSPLLVLEAMKMETTLYAEAPAVVAKIQVLAGAMIDHGATLIELSPLPPATPPMPDSAR